MSIKMRRTILIIVGFFLMAIGLLIKIAPGSEIANKDTALILSSTWTAVGIILLAIAIAISSDEY